ncbi:MAG TPA: pirin family protein [Chitinophagaceae bacterium]|nr:pirin family protein [Chitinophagaceae bacterium]
MRTIIHESETRGQADHGWLHSHHTFSFAGYYNPERVHFGLLRVLNDDVVAPGKGFGKHPHDNMEIVSIPLSGSLAHQDSTGRSEVIKTNDVQIMSAGSGILHSEMNASSIEPVNFLQIWIFPKEKDISPRYEQKTFDPLQRINIIQTVVSPRKEDGGVWINQDAWFSRLTLRQFHEITYPVHLQSNGVYVFVINGEVSIANSPLKKRDAMGITDADRFIIKANKDSELLFIEVPMR